MKRLLKVTAKPGCTKRQRVLIKKHASIIEKHLAEAMRKEMLRRVLYGK